MGPGTCSGRILAWRVVVTAVIAVTLVTTAGAAVSATHATVGEHPGTTASPTSLSADVGGLSTSTDVRGLSVSAGADEVVVGVGASVTVSGSGAEGGSVRIYGIGPRGRVLGTDGPSHEGASVSGEGSFEVDFSVFDRAGTYVFVAVAPGSDGSFSHGADTGTRNTKTQRQNVEVIRNAYLGPDSDDQLAETEIGTVSPDLAIDEPADGTEVETGELSVSGSTNLPDGELLIDLVEPDGDVAVSDNTTMSGGSWSTTLDLSEVDPGRYTVHAHNTSSGDAVEIWILTADGTRPNPLTLTPRTARSGTPAEEYTIPEPGTQVHTKTVVETVERTVIRTILRARNTTTKSGGLSGFGPEVAIVSLVAALLLAVRRHQL